MGSNPGPSLISVTLNYPLDLSFLVHNMGGADREEKKKQNCTSLTKMCEIQKRQQGRCLEYCSSL